VAKACEIYDDTVAALEETRMGMTEHDLIGVYRAFLSPQGGAAYIAFLAVMPMRPRQPASAQNVTRSRHSRRGM
jgi:hypothetical protein